MPPQRSAVAYEKTTVQASADGHPFAATSSASTSDTQLHSPNTQVKHLQKVLIGVVLASLLIGAAVFGLVVRPDVDWNRLELPLVLPRRPALSESTARGSERCHSTHGTLLRAFPRLP